MPASLSSVIPAQNSTWYNFYSIEFENPKEMSHSMVITQWFKSRRVPFPKKVDINEDQNIKFEDSKYYMSPYLTKNMKSFFLYDVPRTM